MKRKLFLILFVIFTSYIGYAQTSTETFETETNVSTNFSDNGVIFIIVPYVGGFDVQARYPGAGWSGTAKDNRYIDNTGAGATNASFAIKTTSNLFKVNKFWVFLSNDALNQTVKGTLTITGKLGGVTKFSTVKNNGFVTSLGNTNGYTLIDLTNLNEQNYSNIVIDELVLTAGGAYTYMGFDAFTWVKDSGTIIGVLTLTGSQTNVRSPGGNDGTATVSVSGGVRPYTYSWYPSGGSSSTANDLSAGNYTVIVKDANNNISTKSFTITEPLYAYVGSSPESCGQANGTASVSVTGGVAPYTYSWSPYGGTSQDAYGLKAGTYTVTVKDQTGAVVTGFGSVLPATQEIRSPKIKLNYNIGDKLSTFNMIGENIKWYTSEDDAINHTNAIPSSTVIENNTIYFATQTIGSCESNTPIAIHTMYQTLNVSGSAKESEIKIYPNPVKNILNLSSHSKIIKVVIVGLSGKKVIEKEMNSETRINVESLPKGVYFIQVYAENENKTIKFIKD